MARFKKIRRFGRRAAARFSPKFSSRKGAGVTLLHPDAMVYGAVRQWSSDKLLGIANSFGVPTIAGQFSDELVMGVANWLVAKNTSGFMRNVALKGLIVENARIGEAGAQMVFGTMTSSSNNAVTGYSY